MNLPEKYKDPHEGQLYVYYKDLNDHVKWLDQECIKAMEQRNDELARAICDERWRYYCAHLSSF